MRTKKIMTGALAALSLASLLYCFAAYLYIQPRLTPATPEPTAAIRTLGNFTVQAASWPEGRVSGGTQRPGPWGPSAEATRSSWPT